MGESHPAHPTGVPGPAGWARPASLTPSHFPASHGPYIIQLQFSTFIMTTEQNICSLHRMRTSTLRRSFSFPHFRCRPRCVLLPHGSLLLHQRLWTHTHMGPYAGTTINTCAYEPTGK